MEIAYHILLLNFNIMLSLGMILYYLNDKNSYGMISWWMGFLIYILIHIIIIQNKIRLEEE